MSKQIKKLQQHNAALLSQIRAAKGKPHKRQQKKQSGAGRRGYAPGLASTIGMAIGGYAAGPAGAAMGRQAGNWFGKISGMGAYKIRRNTLMSNSPPTFKTGANGSIEISHREFLQDISTSVAFVNTAFAINPGLQATFPFLSQLAQNYEQYELLGLIFEFKTTSGTSVASTNTALGVVVASTNYDTLDSNFTSKQQMEAYEYTVSTVPCASVIHPVECDPRQNTLSTMYVRTGAVPSGADQRFYDIGNFQIATVGSQAAAVAGELWVSYHVRLLKPKLSTPLGAALPQAHIVESPAGTAAAAGGSFLGTTGGVLRAGNTIPIVCTKSTFTLPNVGVYQVAGVWTGSVAAIPTWTLGSNITLYNNVLTDNAAINEYISGSGQSNGLIIFNVTLPGTGAANTVTIGQLTSLAAGTADLIVTQLSSGFL